MTVGRGAVVATAAVGATATGISRIQAYLTGGKIGNPDGTGLPSARIRIAASQGNCRQGEVVSSIARL